MNFSINLQQVYLYFYLVGGGTGGLTVGRRLAENQKNSILVLESGDVPKEGIAIPANAPTYISDADLTFRYVSVPQQNAALYFNGSASIISGRILGGMSSLNYMHFNRGSPFNYDEWARSTGDESWSYSKMLPYLKRIETYAGDYPSDQHGYSGPVMVSRPKYAPGLDIWLEAGRSLGYPIKDPNGPQQISFTATEFSKRVGRRDSSYTAYIKPILAIRPNLHILTNVNATQIIFSGKRAVGVKFDAKAENSSENIVYARKEIIVSAGVFGSPLLLMRSGIGPRDVLEGAKIPIVQELPVGKNLHDHVAIALDFYINNSSAIVDPARDFTPENLELFHRTGDGPYSSAGGATGQAFLASSVAKAEGKSDFADIHLTMAHSSEPYLLVENNSTTDDGGKGVPMSVEVFVVRPKSRGSIKLNVDDPNGPPLIDPQYLMDPRDLQIALDGVKETFRIMETTDSYRRLQATFWSVDLPACKNYRMRSDEYLKCFIKQLSQTGCHAGGSCKMGRGPEDPTAVVDTQLRVIGIDGLRVADASVMPTIVNANTQVAVYAIAERVSELILQRWQQPQPPFKNFRFEKSHFHNRRYFKGY
ncbi:unnamed protein product [Orchesella dallaii]|uniref:Glucose dehydrogenase [FAD, quinone] n=1 Tax=Orchesella dallaii TaxID=48710 RepID=A0ABP1QKS6_9HEXA